MVVWPAIFPLRLLLLLLLALVTVEWFSSNSLSNPASAHVDSMSEMLVEDRGYLESVEIPMIRSVTVGV